MGCSSGIFWGVLIIIIGIVVIINVIFGSKIPIFPLIIGLILIYFGIRIIAGMSCRRSVKVAAFEEKNIETKAGGKYDVVFGKSVIDLTGIELKEGISKVEVNTIFGSSVIKIDPNMPVKIRASSAFGSARTPDENMVSFGEHTYKSDSLKTTETKNYLLIVLNVVFGSSEVVSK